MKLFATIFPIFLPALALVVIQLFRDFKRGRKYSLLYRELRFKKFYRSDKYIYSHQAGEKDDGFAWHPNKSYFHFANNLYLRRLWCDPVGTFWTGKFERWLKENVNIEHLPYYYSPFCSSSNLKTEDDFPSLHAYDGYLRRYYAGIALRALANKEALNEALVRDVMEVANKLVAELRFKERTAAEEPAE